MARGLFSLSIPSGISSGEVSGQIKALDRQPVPRPDYPGILRFVLSAIDLTSLGGADTRKKIKQLCSGATSLRQENLPLPAAVCVYPPFISQARKLLKGTGIKIATVAGAFPSGQMALSVKLNEIEYALGEGADEVDVVISRGTFLDRKYDVVFRELEAMRQATRGKTLKVILETGELGSQENIARAAGIAIEAGADFIKTSTGKIHPGATEEAVAVMLFTLRNYYAVSGHRTGIKIAGGVRETEQALRFYQLVLNILGEEWLVPSLCRFGASNLVENIAIFFRTFDQNKPV